MSARRRSELMVEHAMALAAGLGQRMRPLTESRPKPLIPVAGKPLIAHALDRLRADGVKEVVVNVHHFADRLEAYLETIAAPAIAISDERGELLDTGGGIVKALPRLGTAPFFVVNSDSLWFDGPKPALARLRAAWDDGRMDCLLLIAPVLGAVGYDGAGDFFLDRAGRLARPAPGAAAPYVHTGCYLVHPRLFAAAPAGRFSMNLLWNQAIAEGRLYGLAHDGLWLHVGTPKGLAEAEAALSAG